MSEVRLGMLLDERCDEGCYFELVEGVRPQYRCHGKCALIEQAEMQEDEDSPPAEK